MVNYPKAKGTAFESSLLPYIRNFYPYAERRVQGGAQDKGDYNLPGESRFILEAKCHKSMSLSEWLSEAEKEAKNAGVPYGIVVHKRRGKTDPAMQYVTMTLKTFMELVN